MTGGLSAAWAVPSITYEQRAVQFRAVIMLAETLQSGVLLPWLEAAQQAARDAGAGPAVVELEDVIRQVQFRHSRQRETGYVG